MARKNERRIENILDNPAWKLKISMWLIPWVTLLDKFGASIDVTTSDPNTEIREYKQKYTYTDNAWATYYMSSSDNWDTQSIIMNVLTVDSNWNWNEEVIEQSLVWQTKTEIITPSWDPIVRIYRVENNASTWWDFVGNIYIYEDDTTTNWVPNTTTKVRATVVDWNNQTQMAIYTVPTGYVWFLMRWEVWISKSWFVSAEANFSYRSRRYWMVFKNKKTITLNTDWTSYYTDVRSIPDVIPARTDISLRINSVSATTWTVWTFDILLVDENYLTDKFLNKIWQVQRIIS